MFTPDNGLMFAVVSIDMGYPNIQVTAKRRYTVKAGLTQGVEREYVIGFEGSALRADSVSTHPRGLVCTSYCMHMT